MSDKLKVITRLAFTAVLTVAACLFMPVLSNDLDYSWGTGTGIMHEARVEQKKQLSRPLSVVLLAMQEEIEYLRERVHELERDVRKLRKAAKEKQ